MQKTIEEYDEVSDFQNAVQIDPYFEMPRNVYADERQFYFEQLAKVHEIRPLELRVGLSNVWIFMARNMQRRA